MRYRTFDHTADLGLEIFGPTLAALFANAGLALFDLITDISLLRAETKRPVTVQGLDLPDLLVNWLRELLALWTVEAQLAAEIEILSIAETALSAQLHCTDYDPGRHFLQQEIKAVTYHQARVQPTDTGWQARLVLDV